MNFCTKTDKAMNGKAPVIEFYRYVFMVVLLAWHGGKYCFSNGYLVVEFFFILSGYLLMESYLRKPKTAVQYTVDKLKRTYLEYFVALCFTFLYYLLGNWFYHTISIEMIFKFIYEAALIQNIGIFNGGYNGPMWYFCVLIWGGAFLYYLLKRYTELSTHLLIPIISLTTLVFLCNHGDSLENFNNYGGIYIPFMRGISEMGIGILLCAFAHSRYNKISNSAWLDCCSIGSALLTFYLLYTNANYDRYVFLTFPIIIFVGMRNRNFLEATFHHTIWIKLGSITYEMYLIHTVLGAVFIKVMEWLEIWWNLYLFLIYVFFITSAAFIFKAGCQKLQCLIFHKKYDTSL